MFEFTRSYGYVAIIYFFSLIIIGVMIFLNLFLAILLENFDMTEEEEKAAADGEEQPLQSEDSTIKTLAVKVKDSY